MVNTGFCRTLRGEEAPASWLSWLCPCPAHGVTCFPPKNQEKLLQELRRLQQEDLARKRQLVAQMPAQLAELPYRRTEAQEDRQRELEFAFEDLYNADHSEGLRGVSSTAWGGGLDWRVLLSQMVLEMGT